MHGILLLVAVILTLTVGYGYTQISGGVMGRQKAAITETGTEVTEGQTQATEGETEVTGGGEVQPDL